MLAECFAGGSDMFVTRMLTDMNARVENFGVLDIKLAQGAAIFLVLTIVKLVPQITDLSIWWFVILMIACAIRPVWLFLGRK
jgi:hypothetical protein